MALGFYSGFYVKKTHPDPAKPPIHLDLLDEAWEINEKMVSDVDEVFNDIPMWTVTRYNASKVKRVAPSSLKSFDTTNTEVIFGSVTLNLEDTSTTITTVTTSQEDRFGDFKLRQNMTNKVTRDDLDIFQYSDNRLKNGLDADFLRDSDGHPIDVYKKKDFLVRNWVYQEITETMGWVLLHIDAFWDRGPLFKLGCGVYHSTWPQPPPGDLYANGTPIDFVGTVLPVGFLREGYWNVYYNFEHSRYNIDIPGGGSVAIHKVFEGPGFKRPKPHLYDIVTIRETVQLVGQSPLFPDRAYNSGAITWQSVWQTVPPELAPFILYDCPYS